MDLPSEEDAGGRRALVAVGPRERAAGPGAPRPGGQRGQGGATKQILRPAAAAASQYEPLVGDDDAEEGRPAAAAAAAPSALALRDNTRDIIAHAAVRARQAASYAALDTAAREGLRQLAIAARGGGGGGGAETPQQALDSRCPRAAWGRGADAEAAAKAVVRAKKVQDAGAALRRRARRLRRVRRWQRLQAAGEGAAALAPEDAELLRVWYGSAGAGEGGSEAEAAEAAAEEEEEGKGGADAEMDAPPRTPTLATMRAVVEAAKAANAHAFISAFPDGYETLVGERGLALSGGQKQRVAIARAILRSPGLLLLDEATSALDAESEFLVQQALDRLMPGRSTIIIAHRLSTVRRATRICVIEGGAVIEEGTHDALIAKNGAYAALVKRQLEAHRDE